MNVRSALRRHVQWAWRASIEADYCRQRINSERSLQASLWSNLNRILPANRRMFIEPLLSARGARRFPDIVVCNSRFVIAVIELKYQPRARPTWHKDLKTFEWVAQHKANITVSNHRFRGSKADSRTYSMARQVLYVWAGMHRDSSAYLTHVLKPAYRKAFMELHAITSASGQPRLRVGAKWL